MTFWKTGKQDTPVAAWKLQILFTGEKRAEQCLKKIFRFVNPSISHLWFHQQQRKPYFFISSLMFVFTQKQYFVAALSKWTDGVSCVHKHHALLAWGQATCAELGILACSLWYDELDSFAYRNSKTLISFACTWRTPQFLLEASGSLWSHEVEPDEDFSQRFLSQICPAWLISFFSTLNFWKPPRQKHKK